MDVNNSSNMTYLPVAEGLGPKNPNSSAHLNYNKVHGDYNAYVKEEVERLAERCKKGNMSQSGLLGKIKKASRV